MKKILIILTIISICYSYGQKYIMLDSLSKKFKVKEYTLNTKALYGINKNIIVYNIFVDNKRILLLSILPELEENKTYKEGITDYEKLANVIGKGSLEKKELYWKKINFDDIKNNIITISDINYITSEWEIANTPDKKTFSYSLVKRVGNDYYVPKNCLTEFFTIADVKPPLIAPYGTINISEPKTTIREIKEIFKNRFPNFPFPLDVNNIGMRYLDVSFSLHNYFSKEYIIKGNKAYQFWTLDGWWYTDGLNEQRGIDRFVYIPGKGIVGGSYDFYFRKLIVNSLLWDNIINEKIMIAEELK
ncbi:hypothetical protein [Elizabethkingia meningoseptica]|uniref:hypothetical protein n=1 Tax=Elizabethkingia meningoseptica TaxID=238 RepID=UPI0023AEC6AF|nr:hypothetical protein [Elizabethkingia meningoseptica]